MTLNNKMKGPDHKTSLEPKEFQMFVKCLRNTKFISGSSKKRATSQEIKLAKLVRKRVVAKTNIIKNEIFSLNNITTKRSDKGTDASKYFNLINKRAKKNYKIDQPI